MATKRKGASIASKADIAKNKAASDKYMKAKKAAVDKLAGGMKGTGRKTSGSAT